VQELAVPLDSDGRIEVCPNCGRVLQPDDFPSGIWRIDLSYANLKSNIYRCSCTSCGYRGIPILARKEDAGKMPFAKKKVIIKLLPPDFA